MRRVQRDVAVVGAGYVGLPLAVRLANDPMDVRKAEWERGAKLIGWERRAALSSKNREAAAKDLPLRRGLGCAASVQPSTRKRLVSPGRCWRASAQVTQSIAARSAAFTPKAFSSAVLAND